MSITIQLRRDTAANWTAANPALARGEIGLEYDTGAMKIGDGARTWSALPYASAVTSVAGKAGAVTLVIADVGGLSDALLNKADLVGGRLDPSEAPDVSWTSIQNVPTTFPPAPHDEPLGNVTGLTDALAAKADLVGGKLNPAQAPDIALTQFLGTVADQTAMLALVGQIGDWCIRSDTSTVFIATADGLTSAANWQQMAYPPSPVSSVAGRTGAITLSAADVGLGNVDNTADAAKPISTATATALSAKADAVRTISAGAGLSGGGDLTTDRTLAVTFGTATGTVCDGGDTRLSDTRTPTDGTVTDAKIAANAAIALSKLATGAVSASNNGTAANATIVFCTQAQYDALGTGRPATTVYVAVG